MKNKLFLLLLAGITFSGHGMDLPFDDGSTNQALAKFSGCFVAIRGVPYNGYPLTNDPSLAFAYLYPQDATAKNFIGYTIFVLRKSCPEGTMACGMPEGLCARPGLGLRMATSSEIALAKEKIKNNESQLSHVPNRMDAIRFLQSAAKVLSKRKEYEELVLTRKRQRHSAKKSDYVY